MMDKPKYVQFPLYLWRDIFSRKVEVINKIFCFGVYWHSKRFDYSLPNVARQIIYDLYNNKLGVKLKKCITALKSDVIGCNEDYRGFDNNGRQFEPTDEMEELLQAFEMDDNLKAMAVEHYQMHMAFESLEMNGDIEHNLKIGKQIESEKPKNEPMPMLSKALLFEFRDKEKSEFELAQFAAHMAIHSIIGKKPFATTNKLHIVARMFGYSSHKAISEQLNPAVKERLIKYSNRYHMGKLLQELEFNWHVVIYGKHTHCLYVSTKMSRDMLVLTAEARKKKRKIAKLKGEKFVAEVRAKKILDARGNVPLTKETPPADDDGLPF